MNRNQLVLISIAAASLLAIAGSQMVWSKGHVPLGEVQMCHKGVAINVDSPAQFGHIGHGDFFLPACDFNNAFGVGADCSGVSDKNGDGFADKGLKKPRRKASSDACPAGTF